MTTNRAVQKASDESFDASLPPLVRGLPVLGSALGMQQDPLQYLVSQYQRYGPIFRIRLLNRSYTVMAGLDANQFLARHGEDHFGSTETFRGFAHELGSLFITNAMDGPAHKQRRKALRRSHARESLQARLPEVIQITRDYVSQWQDGQSVALLDVMQRMVVHQLGVIQVNQSPGDAYDDFFTLLNTNLWIFMIGVWPRFMLKRPAYLKAKARAYQFGRKIIADHRANPPVNRPFDMVDELLAERDSDGNPLPEETILAETIASYNAGLDTVSNTCCFLLYNILKQPGLRERVTAEIDALFDAGFSDLQAMRGLHTLHSAAMETLRMYPVAPLTRRTVTHSFEFGGYHVEQGTQVFLVNALTHYLPDYFPDPYKFDLNRYQDSAAKSRPANAFAPYTLGAHTCLGAGMAEALTMVVVATLLRTLDLRLDPPDYIAKMHANPIPTLGNRFSLRVVGHRYSH